jgi:dihydropteroate synthase
MGTVAGLPASLDGLGRCLVMGIVNVTPDSFSDGGRWLDPERAVAHGLTLRAQSADILDVGGESTRPGAERIEVSEELRRVVPVVRGLAEAGAVVSIDTMRARVAEAALEAGAVMVNDISGGQADRAMAGVVASARVPYVAMHWRGPSTVMESLAHYADVVADVCAELRARLDALMKAGLAAEQIVLDPGFGFAKQPEHNWRLLAGLEQVLALGRPVLVGTSRKRFLAEALGADRAGGAAPSERDHATAATTTVAALTGAWAVRVHEVSASADAVRVVRLLRVAGGAS